MAKRASIFFNKRLFLFPSALSVVMLTLTFLFPAFMTPKKIILFYWIFGTSLLVILTGLLRNNLKKLATSNRELKLQKAYLENLIESAPEAIIWGDAQRKIKYVNKKFIEMFGYSRQEAVGRDFDGLLSTDLDQEATRAVTKAVENGEANQFEGIRRRKDGANIHVSIVAAPVRGQHGQLELFGLYRDTTDDWIRDQQLKKSERELRKLSKQMSDANNFKELLLDIITHDLRNPASVISGAVELLKSEQYDSEVLDLIEGSITNLHQIIETASTLSKLSVGEEISLDELDLVPLAKAVAHNFESQLTGAGMTLEIYTPDTFRVRSNPIIAEVLSNFLSNGIKYASEGKRLILRLAETQGLPEISVEDFGRTIPEDKRQDIFTRNVQLLDGPKKGSGVGLAIVKRLAEANHAETGVRPNTPRGNIFYFRFKPIPED